METKIGSSLADVREFAIAHAIGFSFSPDVFTALSPVVAARDLLYAVYTLTSSQAEAKRAGINALGISNARERWVAVYDPEGWNSQAYWTALHELGHIFTTDMVRAEAVRSNAEQYADEVGAWRWAKAHAIDWHSDARKFSHATLNSYVQALNITEPVNL